MSESANASIQFKDLDLAPELLQALEEVGYEQPSPIQAQAIPQLLKGLDLLGHAPTGTGKTAAFALPLLSRLDLRRNEVQVLVLTPTRELAIQVAEAFQRYASHIKGFHVLPIYGGQDYSGQIRQLKRGVQVVVGTPGRVMDHMRKGTLKLGGLQAMVLDEADEMLRMGFIDDVEWVLEQVPKQRQMALFSATMPPEIQRIARHHLNKPQEISIKARTATAETIRQRYWLVSGMHKLDALTRILEVEEFDAMLIFVRTKVATTQLAEKLKARGYAADCLNGDMQQKQREQMVERLKKGSLDVLVATDVAARGLDVDRISHVFNYDIPNDTEAYIHRIGRTGRAGREGDAILFVAPRERRMLAAIERATRQKITPLELPSTEIINNKRIADFKQGITDTLALGELDFLQKMLEQYEQEHDVSAMEIAAALAKTALGDRELLLSPDRPPRPEHRQRHDAGFDDARPKRPRKHKSADSEGLETYRIEVGKIHGVKPGNIVGAITNEAGIDGQHIGHIDIHPGYTLVDMPAGMPNDIFQDLKKVRVVGQKLNITRQGEAPEAPSAPPRSKPAHKGKKPDTFKPRPAHAPKPKPEYTSKPKSKPQSEAGSKDAEDDYVPTPKRRKGGFQPAIGKPKPKGKGKFTPASGKPGPKAKRKSKPGFGKAGKPGGSAGARKKGPAKP